MLTFYIYQYSISQKTPKDKKASLVIHGLVDKVFDFIQNCREINFSLHFSLMLAVAYRTGLYLLHQWTKCLDQEPL